MIAQSASISGGGRLSRQRRQLASLFSQGAIWYPEETTSPWIVTSILTAPAEVSPLLIIFISQTETTMAQDARIAVMAGEFSFFTNDASWLRMFSQGALNSWGNPYFGLSSDLSADLSAELS